LSYQWKKLLSTGGVLDEYGMAHNMENTKSTIALAHCNFPSGLEFRDQIFVQSMLKPKSLFWLNLIRGFSPMIIKLSTQVATFSWYNWFYELLETENYDYVLTAHHADDN
jgi:tRNA(Ile)-lysidine synthase